jgi:hypothetical protein
MTPRNQQEKAWNMLLLRTPHRLGIGHKVPGYRAGENCNIGNGVNKETFGQQSWLLSNRANETAIGALIEIRCRYARREERQTVRRSQNHTLPFSLNHKSTTIAHAHDRALRLD